MMMMMTCGSGLDLRTESARPWESIFQFLLGILLIWTCWPSNAIKPVHIASVRPDYVHTDYMP